jgi:FKBP-type peptidyl-prolyl cis-trans isomerase (trigger factor)
MENASSQKLTSVVRKLPSSRVEITVSIPATIFDATRTKAIAHLGEHVELPGFRKGKVPEKILAQRLGEAAILEKMAEITIKNAYPIILSEENIDALGRPEVRLTKVALGNPLEAVITTDVFPELTLPDYAKIASRVKEEKVEVKDEDVEKTITEIRKIRGKHLAEETGKSFDEQIIPELNDTFVKTLGDFASVEDFRAKVRESILKEKEKAAKEKRRIAIVEGILKDLKGDVPNVMTDQELHRMEEEFAHDIERMGMKFDEYIQQLGKTREDIRKDWRPEAERRVKIQLLIAEIARKEGIVASEREVELEVNKLHLLYPNTPPERLKSYVDMILTNEKVFRFLETGEKATPQENEPIAEEKGNAQ